MFPFISPLKIVAGPSSLNQLPDYLASYNSQKIFIVADKGIVDAGIVDKLTTILKNNNYEYDLFTDVIPEPPLHLGDKTVDALLNSNANVVIGIGGGSSLDVAKAASILAVHEGKTADYLNLTGTKKLTKKGLPLVLIPTTSGTGSEVTSTAVFSLENSKDVITDPLLMADLAIVDPELTYTLPSSIMASTGIDALTHALEAYISKQATPLTDGLAEKAIDLISNNIRQAVWNNSDLVAKQNMSWGSLIAGLSFFNAGVSGVHALAYPLGGMFHIPHGVSNAVMLPYVFDYIWPSNLDKLSKISEILDVKQDGLSKRQSAIEGVRAIKNLIVDCGIPLTLKELGITEEAIAELSKAALEQQRLLSRSPKAYSLKNIEEIYSAAFHGTLNIDNIGG